MNEDRRGMESLGGGVEEVGEMVKIWEGGKMR